MMFYAMNQNQSFSKPLSIVKNISISLSNAYTGTTLPVEIDRWVIQNNTKIFEKETVYVNIPMGIDDGEIIVLREKGNVMSDNSCGDVKICISIAYNEFSHFRRNGLDILFEKQISIKDALCGFSFELKHITGKNYTINNKSGNIIHDGFKKIIPNMGFKRDGHIGALIICFRVVFPEKLDESVVEKLRELL